MGVFEWFWTVLTGFGRFGMGFGSLWALMDIYGSEGHPPWPAMSDCSWPWPAMVRWLVTAMDVCLVPDKPAMADHHVVGHDQARDGPVSHRASGAARRGFGPVLSGFG